MTRRSTGNQKAIFNCTKLTSFLSTCLYTHAALQINPNCGALTSDQLYDPASGSCPSLSALQDIPDFGVYGAMSVGTTFWELRTPGTCQFISCQLQTDRYGRGRDGRLRKRHRLFIHTHARTYMYARSLLTRNSRANPCRAGALTTGIATWDPQHQGTVSIIEEMSSNLTFLEDCISSAAGSRLA